MKLATTSLAALVAFIIAAPASAEVLFTDKFDATSNQTPNDQITNPGRQGGTLATLGYLQTGGYYTQIGNPGTYPANTPGAAGDDLLTAYGGRAYVNYNFSSQTFPLEITFRGLVGSGNPDPTNWVSFSVGDNNVQYVNGATVSSILFRANGGTELFDNGAASTGASGFAPGFDVWTDYKVVLSDTAGTGSAWGTGGSRADYYVNGSFVGTFHMTQLTASEGYIGFTTAYISGYDDLKIQTVEPVTNSWNTGDGTWDTSAANWSNPATWTNGNDAFFANTATPSIITLSSGLTAGSVVVGNGGNNANYTFTGGSLSAVSFRVQGDGSNDLGAAGYPITRLNDTTVTTSWDIGVGRAHLVISGNSTVIANRIGGGGIGGITSADWGQVTIQDTANVTATNGIVGNTAAWGLNLNGGTLTTKGIDYGPNTYAGTTNLNFNGTLVKANQDNPDFITRSDTGNHGFAPEIKAGGAKIDTNGYAIGIGVPLQGSGALTKSGSGTLALTGTNTYTGGTLLKGGSVTFNNASALGSGTVIFVSNTDLTGTANMTLANALAVNSGVAATLGSAASTSWVQSGAVTGGGTLIKSGLGTVILSGGLANTFSGPVTVSGGRLVVSDGGLSLKNTTGAITVSSGASFYFAQNFTSNNLTNALTLSGEGNGGLGALHLDFNVRSTGAVTLAGDATIGHDWNGASIDGTITGIDRNLTLASNIAGQGYLSIGGNINLGTGTLIKKGVNGVLLNGTNTFGSAVIQSGLLIFQNHAAIGGSGANITIQADGVAARNGTDLGTLLARVNPASTGAVAFGGSFTTASTALDLTNYPMLSIGSSVPMTYSGIITPGGGNYRLGGGGGTLTVTSALTGANGLIMNDAQGGTVILSGGTYSGATVVNSGTLRTDGTLTGAVSVSSGGTLAPGPATGIGSLNLIQPLTVTGALQMRIDRAGSQKSDQITAPSVNLGGTLTVVNTGAALQNGDTFQLFSVSGNITLNNAALTLPKPPSGLTWDFSRLAVDGTLKVVVLTNTIGDPNWPSQLPAQLQAVYDGGFSSAIINAGTYNLPDVGGSSFQFNSWTNFTIDATGVSFVVGPQRAFTLENCTNVILRGAVIRARSNSFTQGRVLQQGNDSDGTAYAVWRVSDGYPDTFAWWFNAVDQTTRKMDLNTGDLYYDPANATYQSDHKWKLRFPGRTSLPFKVNDWLVARGPSSQDSAVYLVGCRDCTVQSVTSQGGAYATFREIGGGGNRILGCRVEPSPYAPPGGTELPLVSCAADGIHSAFAYPGPHIEDFATEGVMLDDCIAIRGNYATIAEVAGNSLVMDWSGMCVVSDPVRISNPGGFFAQAICTAIVNLGDGRVRITIDQTLPVPVGSKASNPKYNGSGFRVINCRIGNTRSNAMIVKADDGLISGNTISHAYTAIGISPGYYWNESDYSWNNTVANNLVSDCFFGVKMHQDGAIGHRNLSVIDNSFSRITRGKCISIEGCDVITLTGNYFDHHESIPAISLKMANNIRLANNLVDFAGGTAIKLEIGTNVTNLSGEANGIFNSGRAYALSNSLSGLLLAHPFSNAVGATLQQYSNSNASSRWFLQPDGNGHCKIVSAANGLVVGVNQSSSSAAPLILETSGPGEGQRWTLTPVGTSAVKLVNQLSGLAATVQTASLAETVTQLADTSAVGQLWTPAFDDYTYSTWSAAVGASADPMSDDDQDGIYNLLEYALASDPASAGSVTSGNLISATVEGQPVDYLTLACQRRVAATDIVFQVEYSPDLSNWQTNTVLVSSTPDPDGTTREVWRSPPLAGSVSGFLRVRVKTTD